MAKSSESVFEQGIKHFQYFGSSAPTREKKLLHGMDTWGPLALMVERLLLVPADLPITLHSGMFRARSGNLLQEKRSECSVLTNFWLIQWVRPSGASQPVSHRTLHRLGTTHPVEEADRASAKEVSVLSGR
jgi:hypothetical protein